MQGALILAILDVVCFIVQYESCSFDVSFSWKLYKIIFIIVINSSAEVGGQIMLKKDFRGCIQPVKGLLPSPTFQEVEGRRDVTEGSQDQILCHCWSPTQDVAAVPGHSLELGLKDGACQGAAQSTMKGAFNAMQVISEHRGKICFCHCCRYWHSSSLVLVIIQKVVVPTWNNKAWEPLPLKTAADKGRS